LPAPAALDCRSGQKRRTGATARQFSKKQRFIFMTGEQIISVQTSFKKIEPIAEKAAALFYAKLFDVDPHLRSLFRGDMQEQ
jgi:hypothetical protein